MRVPVKARYRHWCGESPTPEAPVEAEQVAGTKAELGGHEIHDAVTVKVPDGKVGELTVAGDGQVLHLEGLGVEHEIDATERRPGGRAEGRKGAGVVQGGVGTLGRAVVELGGAGQDHGWRKGADATAAAVEGVHFLHLHAIAGPGGEPAEGEGASGREGHARDIGDGIAIVGEVAGDDVDAGEGGTIAGQDPAGNAAGGGGKGGSGIEQGEGHDVVALGRCLGLVEDEREHCLDWLGWKGTVGFW